MISARNFKDVQESYFRFLYNLAIPNMQYYILEDENYITPERTLSRNNANNKGQRAQDLKFS